ncbi:MAG: hypothetical protein H6Q91_1824 [Deltaproteobacteria bacterium]|nr:hypothetical protein [Deltaproteobacteria bacterium]
MQSCRAPWALAATLALACALAATSAAVATELEAPLAALQDAARSRRLAEHAQWHALLHYRPTRFGGGVTSLADQPDFFLAPDGKINPAAELDSTLAAFFAPAGAIARVGQHPQCAYAARFAWLASELAFERAGVPVQPCRELDTWRATIGPVRGVSLIFPEAYLNNPASMFGHTLLRIDAAPPTADEERRDLLAWAVNFAADTGTDPGPIFAVKGISGAYGGFFSFWPYSQKVKEYGDWENRDIWEYRLALRAEEVERLLLHVWELRDVRFDYYFFDENCSWALLGLLQAARPALDLQSRFRAWAIPSDTVRATLAEAGLAADPTWRASAATKIAHDARALSDQELRLVRELASGARAPDDAAIAALADVRRAAVIAVAYDLLRHRATPDRVDEERPRSRALLVARSGVPVQGEVGPPPPVPRVRPDRGHETARLRLGSGVRDGHPFLEARARPAYHDLLDPQGGFTRGAQIDFLDLAVRYYPEAQQLRIHEFRLLDIVSLAPRDALFRPISWRFGTALESQLVPRHGALHEAYFWNTGGGAGLTTSLGPLGLAYGFVEARGEVSSHLQPAWALGGGGSAGVLFGDADDRWRAHLHASAIRYALGDPHTRIAIGLDQRLSLTHDDALELRLTAQRDFGESWLEAGLFWNHYF